MKDFTKLSPEAWEKICNRCGKCCLIKLEDEESGEIYYTNVVCRYFDEQKCECTIYERRCELVPECLKLTPQNVDKISWMPPSCAYRRLAEGLPPLPRTTVQGRCVSEEKVNPDDLEDCIVDWEDL